MTHYTRAALVAVLFLAVGCTGTLGTEAPDFAPLEGRIAAAVSDGEIPSLAIAALEGDEVIWAYTAGWADIDASRPATIDTIYRIGSTGKSITATVAALAAERGDIDLEAPVATYLPDFAEQLGDITLAQALNMGAGMPQAVYYAGSSLDVLDMNADTFVARYAMAAMSDRDRYAYSNLGPELAARVISAVTGDDFADYAARELFAPLEMSNATVGAARERDNVATPYQRNMTVFESDDDILPATGAGMTASLNDLAHFAAAHLTGMNRNGEQVLSETVQEMTHTPRTIGLYGFGWARFGEGADAIYLSDGQVNGGQSAILLMPNRNAAVIVMTNMAANAVPGFGIAALDVLVPGAAESFDASLATLEANIGAMTDGDLPPSEWSAAGILWVEGETLPLAATRTAEGIDISIDGGETLHAADSSNEFGVETWRLSCAARFAECNAPGTNADMALALTRGPDGTLEGSLSIDSALGLFPYRVRLVLE